MSTIKTGTTLTTAYQVEGDTTGELVIQTGSTPTTAVTFGSDQSATFAGNQIIEVTDNTNAALRITQLGTGNALLVEDSSNPDSTPFVIDASGQVVVGHTSAVTYASGIVPQFQVNKASSEQMGISRFSADTGASAFVFLKSRGATIGSYDVVSSGDDLGFINWYGTDGTAGIRAAAISGEVDGTPGTNDMPGRLVFSTTADGASSPTERMRLDSSGNLKFNSGYGSVATAYGCRAWVNFNGTGTVAIRASGNVSSITDQGVGRYKVNLTTAMPDTNYVTVGSVLNSTTPGVNGIAWVAGSDDPGATIGSYTTSAFQIGTYYYPTVVTDFQYVQVAIFR